MRMKWTMGAAVAAALVCAQVGWAASMGNGEIKGTVTNDAGQPVGGVMVSAFDDELEMNVSVFSQPDGSFLIHGLADKNFDLRARLLGMEDEWVKNVAVNGDGVHLSLKPADADELQYQRPGHELFPFLKFDNEKDRVNFKMMCMYCHQVGTTGFRTPEEPVDWDTMVRRMQGFGGLYDHTKETLVERLLEAYSDEAVEEWPAWTPPAPPSGRATQVVITEWDEGPFENTMIHDLELGKDGLIWTVDMINDSLISLDPVSGERITYGVPGGKDPEALGNPRKGPHSVERDAEGNMWITLALSGEMAKFDVKTKEWTLVSSNEPPRPRGAYPHTLRLDEKGIVWYTDAGMNSVFSLDPNDDNKVRRFELLRANQAVGGGQGESGGITPYGIDIHPDGTVWYSKLNGNRIGRINPHLVPEYDEARARAAAAKEAGDEAKAEELTAKADELWAEIVKEWVPPHVGPRRLRISPIDGMVWVPGYGSGVLSRFDPKTEEWKTWDMPKAMDEIPYALNVHPQTGHIWVCGTGSDTMTVFNPETEEWTEYLMPSRVTYTREIHFAEDGSVWTCNSNYPARHIERGKGSVIKIEVLDEQLARATD